MFSKLNLALALFLGMSLQAQSHAIISPALGVTGTPVKNNAQRTSAAAPCGNVNVAQTIGTTTPIVAAANGSFAATVTNFDTGVDGSRQVTASVDATGVGQTFTAATVTANGQKAPTNVGSEQVAVQMPAGTTCTGGPSKNLCLVAFKTAGGFGNCVAVQQGAAAAGAATNATVASAAAANSTVASAAAANSTVSTAAAANATVSTAAAANATVSTAAAANATVSTAAAASATVSTAAAASATVSTAAATSAAISSAAAANATVSTAAAGNATVATAAAANATAAAGATTKGKGKGKGKGRKGAAAKAKAAAAAAAANGTAAAAAANGTTAAGAATNATAAADAATNATAPANAAAAAKGKGKAGKAEKVAAARDFRAVGTRAARAFREAFDQLM